MARACRMTAVRRRKPGESALRPILPPFRQSYRYKIMLPSVYAGAQRRFWAPYSHFSFAQKCPLQDAIRTDRDSVVGTATCYGLDSPGIESRWGQNFPQTSRPALGPTQSPLSVRDQVSHPYKTTGKIIVLYILILYFWIANWKTEDPARSCEHDNE
jgi:hypothetical protein